MKTVPPHVYCYDLEWVPCPATGRVLNNLPPATPDEETRLSLWTRAGATSANPHPFLKLALSQIVSISAIHREQLSDGSVKLSLCSYPSVANPEVPERDIITSFVNEVTAVRGQFVGFNSANADWPILIQRGIANCCECPGLGDRPAKPWLGIDYLNKSSDGHLDLADVLMAGASGRGAAMPSLDEIAAALHIPGKLDHAGDGVLDLWNQGDYAALTGYNETDACTTYLLWLRTAFTLVKLTREQVREEMRLFRELLTSLAPTKPHLARFLAEWDRRRALSHGPAPSHRVRVFAAYPHGSTCSLSVDLAQLLPADRRLLESHLVPEPSGHGYFLCELGYDGDGNIAHSSNEQKPLLLTLPTPDTAGVLTAVRSAKVYGEDSRAA